MSQHHKCGGRYKHNTLLEKKMEFFKERDQPINHTQMGMVKAPNNLIIVMTMAFNQVAKNNIVTWIIPDLEMNILNLLNDIYHSNMKCENFQNL
jgi:hypothetical protein